MRTGSETKTKTHHSVATAPTQNFASQVRPFVQTPHNTGTMNGQPPSQPQDDVPPEAEERLTCPERGNYGRERRSPILLG